MSSGELKEELVGRDANLLVKMVQGEWTDDSGARWIVKNKDVECLPSDGGSISLSVRVWDNYLYLSCNSRLERRSGDELLWTFSPIFLQGSTWRRVGRAEDASDTDTDAATSEPSVVSHEQYSEKGDCSRTDDDGWTII